MYARIVEKNCEPSRDGRTRRLKKNRESERVERYLRIFESVFLG